MIRLAFKPDAKEGYVLTLSEDLKIVEMTADCMQYLERGKYIYSYNADLKSMIEGYKFVRLTISSRRNTKISDLIKDGDFRTNFKSYNKLKKGVDLFITDRDG